MPQELIETVVLPNGLTLEIRDQSRSVAADTNKVTLYICAPIPLDPSFFPDKKQYEKMRHCFGETLLFEYKNERSFVPKLEKDQIFRQFLDIFKKDTLPYLSKPDFPRRYALSKYRDVEKNPYQYREMP